MNIYLIKIRRFLKRVTRSIAFYPIIVSFGYFIASLVVLAVEQYPVIQDLKNTLPFLVIQNDETARTILSTFIGGLFTLTVFSFTMVMVVLNQASSNFSPRLLPGLISDIKHQIILGIYIGTLLFCMIVLISVRSRPDTENIIGFSVMISAILGIFCLANFVYFIHNISQEIQIQNIIQEIYNRTDKLVDDEKKRNKDSTIQQAPDTSEWTTIYSKSSGYYRGWSESLFDETTRQIKTTLQILPYQDQYIIQGDPVLKSQHPLSQEEKDNVLDGIRISERKKDGTGYLNGLIKLMEIAVKAMSPGINDPGTAINAIDAICLLLRKKLTYTDIYEVQFDKDGLRVIITTIPTQELMRIIFEPIRKYSKQDASVMYKMTQSLLGIYRIPDFHPSHKKVLINEFLMIGQDIKKHNENENDVEPIVKLLHNVS
ncbi:DUF2254 domain-containing protein [Aquimarina intermedia]|uniref:Putative membrane protein n=1 Tax=Aquimarina intermedia TaxID=350814 RepID=A0A5S5CGP9_9FLAO|nr:DUF2254 domain-containing protein [Aquimarina intermedia]TYP77193.1 putative membrane protein [Aquimarina intermedia]